MSIKLAVNIKKILNFYMLIYVYNYKVYDLLMHKINIYYTRMVYNIHQSDYKKIKYSLYSQLSQEQKGFAAGCSREVIQNGADMPGLSLDDLIQQIMDVLKIFRHNKCYSKDIVEV